MAMFTCLSVCRHSCNQLPRAPVLLEPSSCWHQTKHLKAANMFIGVADLQACNSLLLWARHRGQGSGGGALGRGLLSQPVAVIRLFDCLLSVFTVEERKLFVGMLSKKCNESDVRMMFAPFGTIEECTILREQNGQSRGVQCAVYSVHSRICL